MSTTKKEDQAVCLLLHLGMISFSQGAAICYLCFTEEQTVQID